MWSMDYDDVGTPWPAGWETVVEGDSAVSSVANIL